MVSRRFLIFVALTSTATAFYFLGDFHARANDAFERASYDAKLDALRAELRSQLGKTREGVPAGTSGDVSVNPSDAQRARMVADIKRELQSEMGLLPLQILRERRSSFV